jgi:tetratricopeptide (TPR) repeat protein
MEERIRELLRLGREAYRTREFVRAESFLVQVLEHMDTFADVHNMLGVIYHDRGLFSKAQIHFERALVINPTYTEAALNLAVTYTDLGHYDAAKQVYQRVASTAHEHQGELDPFMRGKIANMYAEIGDVYRSVGFHQQAVVEYTKALTMGPGFVDIRLKLAQALSDGGQREDALVELRRILAERPEFVSARLHLGITLYALGRMAEAVSEWKEVLRYDPTNKSVQMYLNLVKE